MVKEDKGCGSCYGIERWHDLNPFGKVINCHDNIFMVINRWWLTLHKVNGLFTKKEQ